MLKRARSGAYARGTIIRGLAPVLVILFALACVGADDATTRRIADDATEPSEVPTSPAAVLAHKTCIDAFENAVKARDKAIDVAARDYIEALNTALIDEMKQGPPALDEAVKINTDKKAAEAVVAAKRFDMPKAVSVEAEVRRVKYDNGLAAARDAYSKEITRASGQYTSDMHDALKQARSWGPAGVDEARRITEQMRRLAEMTPRFAGDGSDLFRYDDQADSIIYVCDGSGSMVGGKDESLREELKLAVNRLSTGQSFNVLIFQSGGPGPKLHDFAGKLLPATPENQKKLFDFVDNKLTFHGVTDPLPALKMAFSQQPQMIYLLTDGGFESNDPDEPDPSDGPGVIAKIAKLNRNKHVRVSTVLLIRDEEDLPKDEIKEAEETMRKIARDNGGAFSVVQEKPVDAFSPMGP